LKKRRNLNKKKLSVVKSDLIKELADNYPNFLRKDLVKLFEITLYEIQNAIKRSERVELRHVFTIEPRVQKARISRNPKTNQKLNTPEKKAILFKMSKEWSKKINEK
tara:strand:+ start:1787 stop:2107 length:321 start_codon:yes stop_codon:yes gene_type:complete